MSRRRKVGPIYVIVGCSRVVLHVTHPMKQWISYEKCFVSFPYLKGYSPHAHLYNISIDFSRKVERRAYTVGIKRELWMH